MRDLRLCCQAIPFGYCMSKRKPAQDVHDIEDLIPDDCRILASREKLRYTAVPYYDTLRNPFLGNPLSPRKPMSDNSSCLQR